MLRVLMLQRTTPLNSCFDAGNITSSTGLNSRASHGICDLVGTSLILWATIMGLVYHVVVKS